jgi:2-oxoglutarate ferredoxin oxidoreductase subunit beta
VATDRQIKLEHGQPMLFGQERTKGLRVKPGTVSLEVVDLNEDGHSVDDILVHNETDRTIAGLLGAMEPPDFPVALGVLYGHPRDSSYDRSVHAQVAHAKAQKGEGDIKALLYGGHTWTVENN